MDDFSWTYRRHCDELATLTQNRSEGMMNHRCEWTVKMITQPKQSRTWSERSVMFKSDLLPKRNFACFSQIFPGHLSTSTSLFFNKLEEDNIFLIYNSTLRANKVSLFNNLTSLAMNETRFLPWSTSPSLFYVLTRLTTVIAWSFFIFRESEKEDKREIQKYFFVNLSLRSEKV